MEPRELQERISAFPRWHYRFEFADGVATRPPDPGMANRHAQRRRYIFDALLAVTGGSLRGRRVLDLGCNAGYWSLLAAEAQAEFVLGIDAREVHIEQARLVFEAKGIDPARYRFEQGNVFSHPVEEGFDIALCLGLVDHVSRPVELFDVMTRAGAELIVVDTEISRSKESVFEVAKLHDPDSVVDHELVLIPSRQAIYDLAGEFGMAAAPLALNMTDYTGLLDYERGRRLAFICSAGAPLKGLGVEKRPPRLPWWAAALLPARLRAMLRAQTARGG